MGSAVENDAPESYGDHSASMFHVKRALRHAERTRAFGGPRGVERDPPGRVCAHVCTRTGARRVMAMRRPFDWATVT